MSHRQKTSVHLVPQFRDEGEECWKVWRMNRYLFFNGNISKYLWTSNNSSCQQKCLIWLFERIWSARRDLSINFLYFWALHLNKQFSFPIIESPPKWSIASLFLRPTYRWCHCLSSLKTLICGWVLYSFISEHTLIHLQFTLLA